MQVKELTELERLKLALEYSISKKHKKSLVKRIASLKAPEEAKKPKQINLWEV